MPPPPLMLPVITSVTGSSRDPPDSNIHRNTDIIVYAGSVTADLDILAGFPGLLMTYIIQAVIIC